MRATWRVSNSVINIHQEKPIISNYFEKDNVSIHNNTKIVNSFNDFFVNLGPSLAANIPKRKGDNADRGLIMDNVNSIFFVWLKRKKYWILLKGSADCDDLDTILVKYIIESVIDPFTYICNLSFSTGIFANNMKTAKVIPLHKNGDKHVFSNYRQVSLLPQFSKVGKARQIYL